jgi:hypothetical protein
MLSHAFSRSWISRILRVILFSEPQFRELLNSGGIAIFQKVRVFGTSENTSESHDRHMSDLLERFSAARRRLIASAQLLSAQLLKQKEGTNETIACYPSIISEMGHASLVRWSLMKVSAE